MLLLDSFVLKKRHRLSLLFWTAAVKSFHPKSINKRQIQAKYKMYPLVTTISIKTPSYVRSGSEKRLTFIEIYRHEIYDFWRSGNSGKSGKSYSEWVLANVYIWERTLEINAIFCYFR